MARRYGMGVALGLAVCGGLATGAKQWLTAAASLPAAEALVFDPPLVSRLQPWILPGASYEFTVQLRQQGTAPARIDELRFSCPCATGRLGENLPLPITLAPGEALPVHVTVTSQRGERGRVELRYGVIGEVGGERVGRGQDFQWSIGLEAGTCCSAVVPIHSSVRSVCAGNWCDFLRLSLGMAGPS